MRKIYTLALALVSFVGAGAQGTLNYPGSPFCSAAGSALPQYSGGTAGTYNATPAGLSLNATTGSIDLASSLAGSYTVSNSHGGSSIVSIRPSELIAATPNEVVCAGSNAAALAFSGPAGISFTWANNNPSIGLGASGSGSLPSFTTANAGNTPQMATIRVSSSGGTGCTQKIMSFRITVNPLPVLSAVPDIAVCAGSSTATLAFQSNMAGTLSGWTNSSPSIGLPAVGSGDITPFTALNSSAGDVDAVVTVTPVFAGCSGAAQSFHLTVHPSARSLAYGAASYCPSGTTRPQLQASAGGTFSATPAGLSLNAASGGIVLASSQPNIYNITYTVSTAPGCPAIASTQLTVKGQTSVNPVPNQTICATLSSDPVSFTGTAATYQWTNDNTTIGLAASGSGNISDFVTSTPGGSIEVARIRVVPQALGALCAGKPMVFVYKVRPFPELTSVPASVHYCRGDLVPAQTFTGTVAGTTFSWENSNPAIGLAPLTGTGPVPAFTAANPTSGPILSEISVYLSANGCDGDAYLYRYFIDDCGNRPSGTGATDATARTVQATLAPNPARNLVAIDMQGVEGTYTVRVLSQQGAAMGRPVIFSGSTGSINVTGLMPGAYMLEIVNVQTKQVCRKQLFKL